MNNPKVSVIIPFYNVKEYIKECLDSLEAQTFYDFEAILVNDGSTDGSELIAQIYLERNDNFIMIDQANKGLSAARNSGLQRASGEYVLFLDSDDYIEKDALDNLYKRAKESDLDVINFESYTLIHETKETIREPYKGEYSRIYTGVDAFEEMRKNGDDRLINCCWIFIRRAIIEENNLRFYEGILHEDNLFQWLLMAVSQRVYIWNEPIYYHRVRDNSIITNRNNLYQKWRGLIICAKEADAYLDKHTELSKTNMKLYVRNMIINAINYGYLIMDDSTKNWKEKHELHRVERKIVIKNKWWTEKHLLYYIIWPWGYKKYIQIVKSLSGEKK